MNDLSISTVSPDNNTGRVENFQPQTGNLQASGGNLQPVTGSQNGNWQDILNSNRISIPLPGSQAAPSVQSSPAKDTGGFGWLPLIAGIILFLIVVIAVVRFRIKQEGSHRRNTPDGAPPETKAKSQPRINGQAAKPKPASKKRKGKKQARRRRKRG